MIDENNHAEVLEHLKDQIVNAAVQTGASLNKQSKDGRALIASESQDHAGYWALLDTRVAGNRCRIYATEQEATQAMEDQVTRAAEHAAREAREKLLVVHREWGAQPNEPLNGRHG